MDVPLGVAGGGFHLLEEICCLLGGEVRVEDREVDFLFLGEVQLDQREEAV